MPKPIGLRNYHATFARIIDIGYYAVKKQKNPQDYDMTDTPTHDNGTQIHEQPCPIYMHINHTPPQL